MSEDEVGKRNSLSRVRVTVMLVGGAVAAVAVGLLGSWIYAPIVGWIVACAIYNLWVWLTIARLDGEHTAEHASREDPSRTTSDTLLLAGSVASLVALGYLTVQAHSGSGGERALAAAIGIGSVALSWLFVHTLYTVRYAVLYYADGGKPVDFNEDAMPRYLDFAYLAFTVGMTFQVSDTDIRSGTIRAVILRHMLVSYLFGAVILAAAVNLVAGLA